MLRPDHLFPHDLTNQHHQDLTRNVEELQEHGLPLSRRASSSRSLARQVSAASSFHGDKVEDLHAEHICAILKSDPNKGLSEDKAQERLQKDGPNQLTQEPRLGLFMLFLLQLTSFIIILLIIAAIASIVVNATNEGSRDEILSYTTGMAIFVLVILNAGIAAYTEHQAGNALDALAKLSQPEVSVLRGGDVVNIPTVDVVRGDIILLETGDVVPADLRLITASDLKVDEKALTGEPDDVSKNTKIKEQTKLTPENMVFSGCPVANGKCKGVVVATGMDTRIGEIAKMMASEDTERGRCDCLPSSAENKTPLQENIESLGARIGILAILICGIVFIIGLLIDTKDPEYPENPSWIYMILIAVTLAVAAIPEGIPLCVTISLAIGCKEMVDKNVQVRKIAAVETLGSASVICSDKTGTLTEGKMTMTKMWSGGVEYNLTGQGFDPTKGAIFRAGAVMPPGVNSNRELGVRSTLLSALLCSDTQLFCAEDDSGERTWQYRGNSSEAPIVVAARKAGLPEDITAQYRRVLTIPFSSSRKMMLTVTDVSGRSHLCDGGMALPPQTSSFTVCKGAPNWIIQNCSSILREDGSIAPLSEAEKQQINAQVVDAYSDLALRVLAVAVGCIQQPPLDIENEDISVEEKFEALKSGLTLCGMVASLDPDREGVQESVLAARNAGIRVVMITGDYLKTAIAIARRVEILQDQDNVADAAVDCNALRPAGDEHYLSDDKIDDMTMRVRVFARAKPADKLEIVKSLQRQGLVCAMTGDGVNDAPALHEARIGVAMGLQGTEVAKGAAEMVLTDDNFTSIVKAVEKGRAIYAGIQKFVAFIMSVHIAEVIQIFFCVVVRLPLMRTPLQILFLILVTDLPPSIALGMEPGERNILDQPPRPKEEPIVLGWMWVSICLNGFILSAVIIGIYVTALQHYLGVVFLSDILSLKNPGGGISLSQDEIDDIDLNLSKARTVAFVSLVFCENVRAYICRSFSEPVWVDLCTNPVMQKAVLMAQVAMLCAVLIPFFSTEILGLDGLHIGWWGWLFSLVGPAATLVLCELSKLLTKWQMKRYQRQLKLMSDEGLSDEDGPTSLDDSSDSDFVR